jgi:hypothetical protein
LGSDTNNICALFVSKCFSFSVLWRIHLRERKLGRTMSQKEFEPMWEDVFGEPLQYDTDSGPEDNPQKFEVEFFQYSQEQRAMIKKNLEGSEREDEKSRD